jgi:hypothetical protein
MSIEYGKTTFECYNINNTSATANAAVCHYFIHSLIFESLRCTL